MASQPNAEARIEGFKNRNGCDNRKTDRPRQVNGNLQFHSCYCDHLDHDFGFLMSLFDQYEKGFLPYKGSITEQPNKIMDVFNLISQLKLELENKMRKESKGNK